MYLRCYRFRYVGRIPGGNLLLKYHNLHRNPDEYVHRVYNPATGDEVFNEPLQRYQFPTFSEVLDELEYLAQKPVTSAGMSCDDHCRRVIADKHTRLAEQPPRRRPS